MPRRRPLLYLFVLLLAGSTAMAQGASEPDADGLERFVRQDCGACHGMSLRGGLGPDLRPEALAHWDAAGLAQIILDGIPGTAMPPWRPIVSDAEAQWIARYLLSRE